MYFIKSLCDDFLDLFKKSIVFRTLFILFAIETMGTVSYSTYCMTIKDNSDSCLITFGASCLSLMIIGASLLFSCLFYFIK
jgi:hypothetical protein